MRFYRFHAFAWSVVLLAATFVGAQAFAAVPQPPLITDGVVTAVSATSTTVFFGGSFAKVGPYTGSIALVNDSNGNISSYTQRVNGTVRVAVPDGSGGWYLGGDFTEVEGVPRNRLARILADGTLDATWIPYASASVLAMTRTATALYIGGSFTSVNGTTRNYLAAVDLVTGSLLSFNPNLNNGVTALATDGTLIYAGGDFSSVNGGSSARSKAAAFSVSGTATSWDPSLSSIVWDIAIQGSTVWISGDFSTVNLSTSPVTRRSIAEFDLVTGIATGFDAGVTSGSVYSIDVAGTTLVAGGTFTTVNGIFPRNRIAAFNTGTGTVQAWNPDASNTVSSVETDGTFVYAAGSFSSIGGSGRAGAAKLRLDNGVAEAWDPRPQAGTVLFTRLDGSNVLLGGSFVMMNTVTRNNAASIDAVTKALTPWDPNLDNTVNAIALYGSTVFLVGQFTQVKGGIPRSKGASFDAVTGNLGTWNPGTSGIIYDAKVSGDILFVSGVSTSISVGYLQSFDLPGGTARGWSPSTNGFVYAIDVVGNTLYAGGTFTSLAGASRMGLGAVDVNSGAALPFNPGAYDVRDLLWDSGTVYAVGEFTTVNGGLVPRLRAAAFDESSGLATAWDPSLSSRGMTLSLNGSTMIIGGTFANVNGGASVRDSLAEVNLSDGIATSTNFGIIGNYVSSATIANGELYVGGNFTAFNSEPRLYFAYRAVPGGPTPTPSPTWTRTPTATLSATRTPSPSDTFTPSPSMTETPSNSATATLSRTATLTFTATPSPPASTQTSTPTATGTATGTPSVTPTPVVGSSTPSPPPTSTLTRTPQDGISDLPQNTGPALGETFIYPSPIRGNSARLAVKMRSAGRIKVTFLNEAGDVVSILEDSLSPGLSGLHVDLLGFASGVYFYVAEISYDGGGAERQSVKKFTVIR